MGITAIVHTYNAERHLDACLSALHGFDELLVIDNESTDRTVDIARRHGARVINKPRDGHRFVEAHRDFGIRQATQPWVLIVDADEIVTPALRDYLYADIAANPQPHALLIPIKNYFMDKWMRCYYPDHILRFLYRDGTHWPAYVHSRPTHQGPVVKIPRQRTDLAFIHLANEGVGQSIAKMNGYTDFEAERRAQGFKPHQLLTQPLFRFVKTFLLKGGWREGWPGFIHAVHDGVYRFYALSKIYEQQRRSRQTDSDLERDTRQALGR